MSVDPSRARRYFRAHYGLTFQAYHRAWRLGLALAALQRGEDMLNVALQYGYESSSGFRDAFKQVFGDPPGRGGDARCVVTQTVESPLGRLVLGATEDGVCLVEFSDRRALETQLGLLRRRLGRAILPGSNEHLAKLSHELSDYFDGTLPEFTVPLVNPGTPFQQAVWGRLREIPYGETISYERLARDVGKPKAWRAVGRANGDNPLAILVPCHRVIQKDGQLRGYGGGLWRKRFLLDHERTVKDGRLPAKTDVHPVPRRHAVAM
jgi:AraC family transcriptional regulator of adaptative response/methylated-DNA-[protein]-cysteine methyltransferase